MKLRPGIIYTAKYEDAQRFALKPHDKWANPMQAYWQFVLLRVIPRENDAPRVQEHYGEVWMMDTYCIPKSRVGYKTNDIIENLIKMSEDGVSWYTICDCVGNYCYKNAIKVDTPEREDIFEEYCDLHDFRSLLPGENYRHYNRDDICHHVHLAHEHGYDWNHGDKGIILIRRDATPDYTEKLKTLSSDFFAKSSRGQVDKWTLRDFEALAYEHRDDPEVIELYMRTKARADLCYAAYEAGRSEQEIFDRQFCRNQMTLPLPEFEQEEEW